MPLEKPGSYGTIAPTGALAKHAKHQEQAGHRPKTVRSVSAPAAKSDRRRALTTGMSATRF